MNRKGSRVKRKQVNEIIARLEPDNLHALSYLGKQQFTERRFTDAQATWETILRRDATWAEAYFYLGAVQAERAHAEAAMIAYRRALSMVIGRYENVDDEEIAEAERIAEAQLAGVVMVWEQVLTQGTVYERALARFQQARQALAQHLVTQGQEHLQHDNAKEAIAHLRWVSVLTPEDGAVRLLLMQAQTSLTFDHGMRYYQAQDYLQALRYFRETLVLDPEHVRARRYLRYAQQCLEGGVSERFRHLDLGDREKN